MKRFLLMLFIALLGVGFVAAEAQAKRLGGGMSSGIKRQTPPPAQPVPPTPAQPAATPGTPPAAAAAAAAAPKRSWLAPMAGLAAGLGLAALASHFGFGAELANLMTMLLLVGVAVFAFRFLMRRKAGAGAAPQGLQYAGAGAGSGVGAPAAGFGSGGATPLLPAQAAAPASTLPAGFDAAGFERAAKMIFIRMQAANDAGDLEDLRRFSTPEMFAAFRLDLQDRPAQTQRTDVVRLDAQVIDFAQEAGDQIVSVRFHGLIREEQDGAAHPFDEVWHLSRPVDGSREWAIAGIAQAEPA